MAEPPDLKIGGWLGLGFGAAGLLLAAVVALALVLLGRIEAAERRQLEVVRPRALAAGRLEREVLHVAIAVRAYALSPDAGRRSAAEAMLEQARAEQATIAAMPRSREGDALFAALAPAVDGYLASAAAYVGGVGDGGDGGAAAAEATLGQRREAALEHVRAFAERQERLAAEASARILELRRATSRTLAVATIAVLALVAATALIVTRRVRRPAMELAHAARQVALGDYASVAGWAAASGPPRRNELAELRRAFGRMAADLQEREERIAAQNEELQAQQEELQSQNEELQAQQEELQSQNEELQAQAQELEAQADQLRTNEDRLQAVVANLGASEERYRRLFQHLSEGFALHEMVWGERGEPVDYRFIEVNPAFERLTGLERARCVGQTVREVLPDLEPEWLERYGRVARTGEPVRFESFAAGLGRYFDVVAFSPGVGQFATLFFDVTDRRRADEALREADRRKDEFIGVLSHELRNPLGPIVNGLRVLERADPASDAARKARAVMHRQVTHLRRLVDDLLDVTRISRGKVNLQRTRLELGALVRHAAEDHASTLAARGVALHVSLPAGELWVDADPARIAQVVGNLLQNAAKFTPSGGRVDVALEADGGGRAVLRVRDTGVGIPADVLPRLFQPFTQAERSLARTDGGLGLGLALVKGLVELHGGSVRARSDGEGRGAELTVELPLDGIAPRAAVAAAARPAPPLRRVLVIEDNVDAADSLADLLRLAGHAVEVARDGAEGVRVALASAPDVVLCDVGLPRLDGYEVARRLRADARLERTLLVALTGYALADDVRRAHEAGFDAHLTKPASPDEIDSVLRRGREPLYAEQPSG